MEQEPEAPPAESVAVQVPEGPEDRLVVPDEIIPPIGGEIDPRQCAYCEWRSESESDDRAISGVKRHITRKHPGKAWVGALREAGDEFSDKKKSPPSADEWNGALARLVQTGTIAGASYLAETDPRLEASDAAIEATVDSLALTRSEAEKVAAPAARIISRMKLNKRAGRAIVENIEIGEVAAILVTTSLRWRRYMRDRRAAINQQPAVPVQRPAEPAPRDGIVEGPPVDNGRTGVLATPEYVRRVQDTRPF